MAGGLNASAGVSVSAPLVPGVLKPAGQWLPLRAGVLMLLSMCGLTSGAAFAQSGAAALADPTRPPAALVETAVQEEEQPDQPPPLGLQTVLLRKGAKPLAIINGQSVELGGMLGESRLISLTETEAVLQGANGKETLRLMPDAERKTVVPTAPSQVESANKSGKKAGKRSKTNSTLTK
ncbi:conserved protein of unknown function [Sterolibacterium denitrificans]|uniref:MSHA biogenesis protein MshK n=2 Tax=Sterolibacterium denitrificans TaxID=157592 RepID=A0A7Z7MVY0_9PROT|nr:hypothetical protein [Sterolibacterium denitrificans]SMB29880.1 conserved protein of unknown function [Sterolibacterium denitrificans]